MRDLIYFCLVYRFLFVYVCLIYRSERCIDAKRPITLLSMRDLIYFCLVYRFLFVYVCLIYRSLFIDTHTQNSHILSRRDVCIVTLLSRNLCSSHFTLEICVLSFSHFNLEIYERYICIWDTCIHIHIYMRHMGI